MDAARTCCRDFCAAASVTDVKPVLHRSGPAAPPVSRRRRRPNLLADTSVAIFTEYVTLVVLIALGAAAGTAALGVPLLRLYRYAQMMIAVPFP